MIKWFKALSTAGKTGVIVGAVFLLLVGVGAAAPCKAQVSYSTNNQTVAFSNTDVNDNTLAKGQTKITNPGINGEEQVQHKITKYTPTSCKSNTNTIVSTTVTKKPVNQVTAIGTQVAPSPVPTPSPSPPQSSPNCTNGTYTNSAGNTVCSPEPAPSAPPGATAQCVDGTYSFSQSRSGTCSHHGGVAQWL